MRSEITIILLAVGAATFTLGAGTVKAQPIDSVESLNNRAVAASPRAKELFPELRNTGPAATRETLKTALADIGSNRAVLASPRTLEDFPALRPLARPRAVPSGNDELAAIRANAALVVSPRMLELYPALTQARPTLVYTYQAALVK